MYKRFNNNFGYFFKQIATIDFDKFYNVRMRIVMHLAMWFLFFLLSYLYYFIELKLSSFLSLAISLRTILSNMAVFYFFFYVFPRFFFSRNIFLNIVTSLLGFYISVILWLLVNHSILYILYINGIEITKGALSGAISKNGKQSLVNALSYKTVISNMSSVIEILAPAFFIKILFDIVRLYGNLLKVEKQNSHLEIQNINIEKDFLKAQLNPHFLFNTLNNLYGLTVKKNDKAPEVVLNISDIMGYTLYESNSEWVSLEKEVDFICNYFALEKMRHQEDTDINLNILGKEFLYKHNIAPLLTFTFIENAFKYGLKSDNPFLNINIDITENNFNFSIENDILSNKISKSATYSFGGIGVENVKKRLNLIYPDHHQLNIQNQNNRYKVDLKIKLKK